MHLREVHVDNQAVIDYQVTAPVLLEKIAGLGNDILPSTKFCYEWNQFYIKPTLL